jgi:hypothetical protein
MIQRAISAVSGGAAKAAKDAQVSQMAMMSALAPLRAAIENTPCRFSWFMHDPSRMAIGLQSRFVPILTTGTVDKRAREIGVAGLAKTYPQRSWRTCTERGFSSILAKGEPDDLVGLLLTLFQYKGSGKEHGVMRQAKLHNWRTMLASRMKVFFCP